MRDSDFATALLLLWIYTHVIPQDDGKWIVWSLIGHFRTMPCNRITKLQFFIDLLFYHCVSVDSMGQKTQGFIYCGSAIYLMVPSRLSCSHKLWRHIIRPMPPLKLHKIRGTSSNKCYICPMVWNCSVKLVTILTNRTNRQNHTDSPFSLFTWRIYYFSKKECERAITCIPGGWKGVAKVRPQLKVPVAQRTIWFMENTANRFNSTRTIHDCDCVWCRNFTERYSMVVLWLNIRQYWKRSRGRNIEWGQQLQFH